MNQLFNQEDLAQNSLKIEIPYDFIKNITILTWKELYYGLLCNFVSLEALIDKARDLLIEDNSETILTIACLYEYEYHLAEAFVSTLAGEEQYQDVNYIKEKWLFITLSWIYENPNKYNNLYAEVEYPLSNSLYEKVTIIWDDFNFPSILTSIIGTEEDLSPEYEYIRISIMEEEFPSQYNMDNNYLEDNYKELKKYLISQKIRFSS